MSLWWLCDSFLKTLWWIRDHVLIASVLCSFVMSLWWIHDHTHSDTVTETFGDIWRHLETVTSQTQWRAILNRHSDAQCTANTSYILWNNLDFNFSHKNCTYCTTSATTTKAYGASAEWISVNARIFIHVNYCVNRLCESIFTMCSK